MKAFITSDPHGYYKPFKNIVESAETLYHPDYFIFLGDYIDNGPESYQVLVYLKQFQETHDNVIILKGNHEQSNLMYSISHWDLSHCRNYLCMSDTMKSFAQQSEFLSFDEAKHVIETNLDLLDWVDKLPTIFTFGNTVFSHTGVNPDDMGDPNYHVNLHPKFFKKVKSLPFTFVMGHIDVQNFLERPYPFLSDNLIMLDTNAYRSGSMCGIYYDLERCKILEILQKTIKEL